MSILSMVIPASFFTSATIDASMSGALGVPLNVYVRGPPHPSTPNIAATAIESTLQLFALMVSPEQGDGSTARAPAGERQMGMRPWRGGAAAPPQVRDRPLTRRLIPGPRASGAPRGRWRGAG